MRAEYAAYRSPSCSFSARSSCRIRISTAALSRFTGRSVVRSALRQLVFVAVPAAFVYGIGAAVGVATG